MNPRELAACAEAAMMTAKAHGKNRVVLYDEASTERPDAPLRERDVRSIAHMKMLQSLSGKLNRLNDVREIGDEIAAELRSLIDYHNCRVFVVDGEELVPVAFRGEFVVETVALPLELLRIKIGDGITGRCAERWRVAADRRCRQLRVRRAHPGHAVDRGVARRRPAPLRLARRRRDRRSRSSASTSSTRTTCACSRCSPATPRSPSRTQACTSRRAARRRARRAARVRPRARDVRRASTRSRAHRRADGGPARLAAHVDLDRGRGGLARPRARSSGTRRGAADRVGRAPLPTRELAPTAMTASSRSSSTPSEFARVVDGSARSRPRPTRSHRSSSAGAAAASSRRSPTGDFGERELRLLGGLAHQAKLAIANASNYEGLERTFVSTVEALANALEANDEYTSTHARWITDLALRVGRELGLDERALKRLELGALLHDIGKIGIPSDDPLEARAGSPPRSARSWRRTRSSASGSSRRSTASRKCGAIVRHCHERWDGRGYPDGLAGESIPLESRIIFVCDAYHAMTTDRPYRKRLSHPEAVRRLREGAGSQFDARRRRGRLDVIGERARSSDSAA